MAERMRSLERMSQALGRAQRRFPPHDNPTGSAPVVRGLGNYEPFENTATDRCSSQTSPPRARGRWGAFRLRGGCSSRTWLAPFRALGFSFQSVVQNQALPRANSEMALLGGSVNTPQSPSRLFRHESVPRVGMGSWPGYGCWVEQPLPSRTSTALPLSFVHGPRETRGAWRR